MTKQAIHNSTHNQYIKCAVVFVNYLQRMNSMVNMKTEQQRDGWAPKPQKGTGFLWGAQNLMIKEACEF